MPAKSRPPVTVLGSGSWGTALAMMLARNGHPVRLWGRDRARQQQMQIERSNEKFLPDLSFPPGLDSIISLTEGISEQTVYLIVIPSHGFRAVLQQLRLLLLEKGFALDATTLLWGTKGMELGSGFLMSQVVEDIWQRPCTMAVISGPSFALEVARELPTALTVACRQEKKAIEIAAWFRQAAVRVYHQTDLIGVQLGGTIKNVMAIATGISDGLGLGANARAALMTRGFAELVRLGQVLGGQKETFMGLTGLGDLVLSCSDDQSRNRRVGLGLGRGKTLEQIIQDIGQEAEGVNTCRALFEMGRQLHIDMPITEQVYRVLNEGQTPESAVQQLLSREPRSEKQSS